MIFKQAQFETYCKSPDLNIKGVLVYGSNVGLVSEYSNKLAKTVTQDLNDPFTCISLDWSEIKNDKGLLVSEYSAQSLMAARRVIILKDVDNDLTQVLQSFIETSPSDTLLVMCGSSNLNSRSSLVTYCSNEKFLGAIACYEDREKDISTSVKQILAEQQITYTRDAFELLCSRMSNDRKSNINEIDKLITYVGTKKHFEADDVRNIVFDASVSMIDDLCFYTFSGLKLKALHAVQNLINEGVEETAIIRGLNRHVNMLLSTKALIEDGFTSSDAIKKVLSKKLFYRYDMGATQASAWSKDRLFDVSSLLYKAEKDCKTTNFPNVEILNYLILTLVSAAAKQLKPYP